MRLAIIGYGKMGKAIEKIALDRDHSVSFIIGNQNKDDIYAINSSNTDVAIEFSTPEAAFENINVLLSSDIPVISGTTGWNDRLDDMIRYVKNNKKSFFYASNFSFSLYLFNKLQEDLAVIMNRFNEYDVHIEEIHHTEKKDKPSGTAITLAKNILKQINRKQDWVCDTEPGLNELLIKTDRIKGVPGTHKIIYSSDFDEIALEHKAKDRIIFAQGAVDAAEFIIEKNGYFTMHDLVESRIAGAKG